MLKSRAIELSKKSIEAKTAFQLFIKEKEKIFSERGVNVVFHYMNPNVYNQHHPVARHKTNDPLLPPYPKFREVAHLQNGAGHYVFVNLYMVSLGHVVVSSDDPKACQEDELNQKDFNGLSQVIRGFNRKGIAFYNYGLESGCSQYHKHFQFAPLTYNPVFDLMIKGYPLKYQYFTSKLTNDEPIDIARAYEALVKKANWKGSYNFLISNGYAALVPRRKATHKCGLNVNSLGVAGHFYVWENKDQWERNHPLTILEDLCVPI